MADSGKGSGRGRQRGAARVASGSRRLSPTCGRCGAEYRAGRCAAPGLPGTPQCTLVDAPPRARAPSAHARFVIPIVLGLLAMRCPPASAASHSAAPRGSIAFPACLRYGEDSIAGARRGGHSCLTCAAPSLGAGRCLTDDPAPASQRTTGGYRSQIGAATTPKMEPRCLSVCCLAARCWATWAFMFSAS